MRKPFKDAVLKLCRVRARRGRRCVRSACRSRVRARGYLAGACLLAAAESTGVRTETADERRLIR
jgi:hypothetical protein